MSIYFLTIFVLLIDFNGLVGGIGAIGSCFGCFKKSRNKINKSSNKRTSQQRQDYVHFSEIVNQPLQVSHKELNKTFRQMCSVILKSQMNTTCRLLFQSQDQFGDQLEMTNVHHQNQLKIIQQEFQNQLKQFQESQRLFQQSQDLVLKKIKDTHDQELHVASHNNRLLRQKIKAIRLLKANDALDFVTISNSESPEIDSMDFVESYEKYKRSKGYQWTQFNFNNFILTDDMKIRTSMLISVNLHYSTLTASQIDDFLKVIHEHDIIASSRNLSDSYYIICEYSTKIQSFLKSIPFLYQNHKIKDIFHQMGLIFNVYIPALSEYFQQFFKMYSEDSLIVKNNPKIKKSADQPQPINNSQINQELLAQQELYNTQVRNSNYSEENMPKQEQEEILFENAKIKDLEALSHNTFGTLFGWICSLQSVADLIRNEENNGTEIKIRYNTSSSNHVVALLFAFIGFVTHFSLSIMIIYLFLNRLYQKIHSHQQIIILSSSTDNYRGYHQHNVMINMIKRYTSLSILMIFSTFCMLIPVLIYFTDYDNFHNDSFYEHTSWWIIAADQIINIICIFLYLPLSIRLYNKICCGMEFICNNCTIPIIKQRILQTMYNGRTSTSATASSEMH